MEENKKPLYNLISLIIMLSLMISLWSTVVEASAPNSTSETPDDYDTLQQFFDFCEYGIDVVNDELEIEKFPPGYVQVTVLDGLHRTGYDNPTGRYTSEDQTYLLFPDRPESGDMATFTASEPFGFYIDSEEGRFYTETELNPDDFDHSLIYRNTKGPGYIVAFEDLWGGGDMNYIDRILEVVLVTSLSSFTISPQEATITTGESQNYTAVATDSYGETVDMTAATLFNIDAGAGGQWEGDTYISEFVGEWTITGTCDNLTDNATLIVRAPPIKYRLTVSSTAGGSVTNPGEGDFPYEEGTGVTLVAEAEEGYQFVNWTGDADTIADINTASTTITMNGDYSITANFEEIPPVPTGCFIATAAYGTRMAEEIQILHEFRDEYLLTNPLGQALVDFYYRFSPSIAYFITEHPSLKPIVRAGLSPAVAMSAVAVNTSLTEKIAIVGLLVLTSVAVTIWATRRRNRGPEHT